MNVTRLAPSPTGALHLGNARTFLVNWLMARQKGWKILLRIEDLDGPRVKPEAAEQAVEDLLWMGLTWDEGPIYQIPRMHHYSAAIETLIRHANAYACVCSRREVDLAASAPHAEDGATIYPGTCRGRFHSAADARERGGREPAVRFAVPAGVIHFDDRFSGSHAVDVAARLGDFVIAKSEGARADGVTRWAPAYQLAVVVDDAAMDVTEVVRGDDLLESAPRQILVYRALGLAERVPNYYHLPLVVGPDGRRLAKRHGDTRLSWYRGRGVPPGRVLALLARWCGITAPAPTGEVADVLDWMLTRFCLESMPRGAVTFTSEDDAWLRAV